LVVRSAEVIGEIRIDLRGENATIASKPGRLDKKSSAGRGDAEHAGAECPPFGMTPERRLNGVDAVRQGQRGRNVAARQEEHADLTRHRERLTR